MSGRQYPATWLSKVSGPRAERPPCIVMLGNAAQRKKRHDVGHIGTGVCGKPHQTTNEGLTRLTVENTVFVVLVHSCQRDGADGAHDLL